MTLITLILQVLLTIPLTLILNFCKNKNVNKINQFIIPLVYIILISALIPAVKTNIYLIVIFEIFIRNFYITNITLEGNKENSVTFIIDSIINMALSIFVYNYFIANVETVIPDPESIKSIVWFLIVMYLLNIYKVTNKEKEKIAKENKKQIKKEYIIMQYAKYKNKYSDIIKSKTPTVNNLLYAIMIHENASTPAINRRIEEYIGAVTKTETRYGIMRVKSYNHISDEESIKIVLNNLEKNAKNIKDKIKPEKLLNDYSDNNKESILNIYNEIEEFSKK